MASPMFFIMPEASRAKTEKRSVREIMAKRLLYPADVPAI